jgi:outer membrane protein TolC
MQKKRATVLLLVAALLCQGCAGPNARLQYLFGNDKSLSHYEDMATRIEYPVEKEMREVDPGLFRAPRSITDLSDVKHRPMKLDECIRMAISRSAILRDDSSFGSPGNILMASPGRAASVYDSAIQETSFLFGNRGPEAALADFDALLTQNLQFGRSEEPQNAPFLNLTAGDTLTDETAQASTRLEKPLANSGTLSLQHDWNYSHNNVPSRLFPSAFTGFLQGEYRQPLLAGSGTEFTRIAGPIGQNLRGVSGVAQGVLISRINSDISLIDFEQSVTTTVRDVENRYWDLYLALKVYDSEIETFRDLVKFGDRLRGRQSESTALFPAEARIHEADARIKGSLADVLDAEARLRRLMGLPLSDGEFITPADHPSEAQMKIDWEASLTEALANRPELRRQKWEIRSTELQLQASKNLYRPRLDLVTNYRVNGFGDNLFGEDDDDGVTDAGYNSAYESLTQGLNTTWNAGVSFSMPVGLRLARAQVRNYELRLVKARAVLSAQEQEIAYELNSSMRNMERWYSLSESSTRRLKAASLAMESSDDRMEKDIRMGDPVAVLSRNLEAKTTLRDAEQAYLRSVVEYNKAIVDLNFRKGMSLRNQAIYLSEGEWNPPAYEDARRRAEATTRAFDNPHLRTEPMEFVGGAAPNAWESVNNVDRPHVTGSPVSEPGPGSDEQNSGVPEVPPESETQSGAEEESGESEGNAPVETGPAAPETESPDAPEKTDNRADSDARPLLIPERKADPVTKTPSSKKARSSETRTSVAENSRKKSVKSGSIRQASESRTVEQEDGDSVPRKPRSVPKSSKPEPWSIRQLFGPAPNLSRDFSKIKPTPPGTFESTPPAKSDSAPEKSSKSSGRE